MTDVLEAGGNAYVVTLADELLALDLSTGVMRWRFPSGAANDRFLPNSTPAIAGDRIYFGTLGGTLYALDARSGSVSWQRNLGARVSTSIAVAGDDLYLGTADGHVHRIAAGTGATRAQLRLDGTPSFKLVPVRGSLLVFVNERGSTTLKSVPLTLEAVGWTQGAPGPGWSSFAWPHVWRSWVAVGRDTGEFAALRLADGEPEWHGKVAGTIAGIGGDETSLYLGTTGGTLYRYPLPGVTR
jgi:outer membrane protein assembly factor BamB